MIGPAAAPGRSLSSLKAFVRSCRLRSVRVSVASAFTSTLYISVEPPMVASRVFKSSSNPPPLGRMSRMLNSDSRSVARESERHRHRRRPHDVGCGPAGDPSSQQLRQRPDAWQGIRDRPRRLQVAPCFLPSVDDRPTGRNQGKHHRQAHRHAQPCYDAEVVDHPDRGEQIHQQAHDGGDRGQRERHGDVSQSHLDGPGYLLAGDTLLAVVRDDLDRVVHRETDQDDRRHGGESIGGPSMSPTLGSATTSPIRLSICESPSGVSASPRKMSVATWALGVSKEFFDLGQGLGDIAPLGKGLGGLRRLRPVPSTLRQVQL